ncbi:MAG: hypothetical protein CME70_12050 [Halobacteriovorax sp.]|nr:hypothetical protein [Halobacteriovorax sp.]|tara:strand:- start:307922 stop:308599 length:678 start_codon:yes stop_codon:yes gene_type:complete
MISLKNLSYSVPSGKSIFEDLSFEVEKGEFLGILGKNGTGKTTLVDLILGSKPASTGEIKVFGEDSFDDEKNYRSDISFLSQDVILPHDISVKDFLSYHGSFYPNYSLEKEKELLKFYSINELDKIGSLSTGQQNKIQIVGALSSNPKLLIVDEVTAVLDPETRARFFKNLMNLKKSGECTILLATNIVEDLIGKVDRVLYLEEKRALIHSPEDIHLLFETEDVA